MGKRNDFCIEGTFPEKQTGNPENLSCFLDFEERGVWNISFENKHILQFQ